MSACITCGKPFQCGMVDAGAAQPCWCTQLPSLPASALAAAAASGNAGCYCPACLRCSQATALGREVATRNRRIDSARRISAPRATGSGMEAQGQSRSAVPA